jgi:site-specific recombinase XerD
MQTTYQNEAIKRGFFEQLKGGRGFSKSSVRSHAEAINQWQIFTKNEDFSAYDKSKAVAFTEWLNTRPAKTKSGKISLVTQDNYLRRVKKFFVWLSDQPGYKSKILKGDVDYLRLSKADAQVARSGTTKKMPTFDDARKIIENISGQSEIDRRDRALISFALITGARIFATVSLKMKNFDKTLKQIDQNPGDGVKTKNSKRILTTFFPIGWEKDFSPMIRSSPQRQAALSITKTAIPKKQLAKMAGLAQEQHVKFSINGVRMSACHISIRTHSAI